MDGNPRGHGIFGGNSPGLKVKRSLFRRGEIALARLVHPKAVGLEVGGHRHLRHIEPSLFAQGSDNLCGQKMCVDHQVPGALVKKANESRQIHFLHGQTQVVGSVAPGPGRTIHQVVKVPQDVRRTIDKVQVRPPVYSAKGGIGQSKHVEVANRCARIELPQRRLDRLGGAEMAGSH